MPLLPDAVDDFVNLTLPNFKRNKFVDISLDLTKYVADRIIKRYKNLERGGPDIRWKVQVRNTGNARPSGLYDVDQTGQSDLTVEAVSPWRSITGNWSYDIFEELFQTDRETIVSELMVREHSCMNDMTKLREEQLWSAPPSSSDTKAPYGIPFFLQKSTATPDGAFNGGNPSGFSSGVCGISSVDYPAWKNWTFKYTSVTPDDLVVKVKRSMYETDFEAPNPHPSLGFSESQYHIFTTYAVREPLERLAESRNDNLKNDVAKYINNVLIGGVPVEAVKYLDKNDTSDPLYGVNFGQFRPYVKKGADMKQTKKNAPHQRNVREIHYDTFYNYKMYNRREGGWVGSKS